MSQRAGGGPENRLPEPLLVKAPEAARLLALSDRKLWELTNRGVIPSVRIGRAVRYDVEDLRRWVAGRKKP